MAAAGPQLRVRFSWRLRHCPVRRWGWVRWAALSLFVWIGALLVTDQFESAKAALELPNATELPVKKILEGGFSEKQNLASIFKNRLSFGGREDIGEKEFNLSAFRISGDDLQRPLIFEMHCPVFRGSFEKAHTVHYRDQFCWRLPVILKNIGYIWIGQHIAMSGGLTKEALFQIILLDNWKEMGAFGGHDRFGIELSGFGGFFGGSQSFFDQPQLPNEQSNLRASYEDEPRSKKPGRIMGNPVPKSVFLWFGAIFVSAITVGVCLGWLVTR
jgi:hypothetical protein